MRCLTAIVTRLRLRWRDQRIADLEQRLSELVSAQQVIRDEIAKTAIELIDARQARERFARGKPLPNTVDRKFPDPAPRSY